MTGGPFGRPTWRGWSRRRRDLSVDASKYVPRDGSKRSAVLARKGFSETSPPVVEPPALPYHAAGRGEYVD
jgi:hypothetical protein